MIGLFTHILFGIILTLSIISHERRTTMKTYAVQYATTTSFEAVVKAKSKEEAEKKVKEVIGEPIVIESSWEVKKQ